MQFQGWSIFLGKRDCKVWITGEERGRLREACPSSKNPGGDGDGEHGTDIHQITVAQFKTSERKRMVFNELQ